jgi:hypothetical protein
MSGKALTEFEKGIMKNIIYLCLFLSFSAHASESDCTQISTRPGDLVEFTQHLSPIFEVFESAIDATPMFKNSTPPVHAKFTNDVAGGLGVIQTAGGILSDDSLGVSVSSLNIVLSNGVVAEADYLFNIKTRYVSPVLDNWGRITKPEECYVSASPVTARPFRLVNRRSGTTLATFQILSDVLFEAFAAVSEFKLW